MKDYLKLEPDRVRLLSKHFTPGRNGRSIRFVVRHHMAMVGGTDEVWRVWQDRPASAHYAVDPKGVVGQLVWDKDTAWANADAVANSEAIAIEHSNSAGPDKDWPISEETIVAGARLAAAVCRYYGLGRPEFGKNIRDHREFTSTTCPYHLAKGGKYHDKWMGEAQRFYDALVTDPENANNNPNQEVEDEPGMMQKILGILTRIKDAVVDVQIQLRGPNLRGWAQLGKNDKGEDLTLVDAVAALRHQVAALDKKLDVLLDRGKVEK